jgi:hypothetical protein
MFLLQKEVEIILILEMVVYLVGSHAHMMVGWL